jgi:hypothetical protein
MKAKPEYLDGILHGYSIKCLGCGYYHIFYTNPAVYKSTWGFNGNLNKPTFTPSLLLTTGSYAQPGYIDDPAIPPTRCHSFVREGKMQFLNDCTHHLKGQTVELPDLEEATNA